MGVKKDNSFVGGNVGDNVSGRTNVHFNSPFYSIL